MPITWMGVVWGMELEVKLDWKGQRSSLGVNISEFDWVRDGGSAGELGDVVGFGGLGQFVARGFRVGIIWMAPATCHRIHAIMQPVYYFSEQLIRP
jgi:hypothetical protein